MKTETSSDSRRRSGRLIIFTLIRRTENPLDWMATLLERGLNLHWQIIRTGALPEPRALHLSSQEWGTWPTTTPLMILRQRSRIRQTNSKRIFTAANSVTTPTDPWPLSTERDSLWFYPKLGRKNPAKGEILRSRKTSKNTMKKSTLRTRSTSTPGFRRCQTAKEPTSSSRAWWGTGTPSKGSLRSTTGCWSWRRASCWGRKTTKSRASSTGQAKPTSTTITTTRQRRMATLETLSARSTTVNSKYLNAS